MRLFFLSFLLTACAHHNPNLIQPPAAELSRLLQEQDKDHDKKITVLDQPSSFSLDNGDGSKTEISGAYGLSNLLQELKLSEGNPFDKRNLFEKPATRISRQIRERYWDNLTRRVDLPHLAQVMPDDKMPKQDFQHLFVPATDEQALNYFKNVDPKLKIQVHAVPPTIDIAYMRSIQDHQGLLTLALTPKNEGVPFVVPGGRFNEMYGWDSYFEALGLLQDGRVDLARAMVDNFVYQIEHYGKILNANRSYYLNRSQPPFLTSMIRATYAKVPASPAREEWLQKSVAAAIKEYESVWNNADRLTPIGLNRYYGNGQGIPPETEAGHFDFILKPAAKRHHLSVAQLSAKYNAGELKDPALDAFFINDRAVRESGHDTTYRWRVGKDDRAADFVTVDLNSLLYKYETDLAALTKDSKWNERAAKRKSLMLKYMWDPNAHMFFDYDFKTAKRSDFISATAFYPLWAKLIDEEQARATVPVLLRALEQPGGLSGAAQASTTKRQGKEHARQWDFPNGWAPHQILAWEGLSNYGMNAERERLIYKWLYMIARNAADFNGTIPEKYDVVKRSHLVFAEYGNVGTNFSYITQEGFGWMNASFQVGFAALSPELRKRLDDLQTPESFQSK